MFLTSKLLLYFSLIAPGRSFLLNPRPLVGHNEKGIFGAVISKISTNDVFSTCNRLQMNEDSRDTASPLPLTKEDLSRIQKAKKRHLKNVPVMILDALVPGQHLTFRTKDPTIRTLLQHCYQTGSDLGILGVNPHTNMPLCRGVTVKLDQKNIHIDPTSQSVEIKVIGDQRIEVQGEAWLDETESFYLADVELVTTDVDEKISEDQKKDARRLSHVLPNAVEKWTQSVLDSKVTDKKGLEEIFSRLGPMPAGLTERSMWIAALINPLPTLRVCIEIRPAMLAARNDYDRMVLAVQAIHSSIDHLTGEKRLF